MTKRTYIGWSRDREGKVVSRPEKTDVSNAITQATGGALLLFQVRSGAII